MVFKVILFAKQLILLAFRLKHMKYITTLFLFGFYSSIGLSQDNKKVLFIGNSYTAGLPQMIEQMALSVGDTLEAFESSAGGQRLSGHLLNQQTKDEITNKNWDYVVLQEQSQLPSFPDSQVEKDCYPYAKLLCDLIYKDNSCKKAMFYMTWGRKNGDQANCGFFKPLCTYKGMDSMLRLRYEYMARVNKAELSPVGAVWREVRESFPTIELYSPDESHPSQEGMYASACCFYASLFRKNPMTIAETMGLDSLTALNIRKSAKKIVFDSLLRWKIGEYDLTADFSFTTNSRYEYVFKNESRNNTKQLWEFEFTTDTSSNPTFGFTKEGKQTVKLTTYNSCDTITIEKEIDIFGLGIGDTEGNKLGIYPNPAKENIKVQLPKASLIEDILILSIDGKMLYKERLGEKREVLELNMESLSTGVYFLVVRTNERTYRVRVFKE